MTKSATADRIPELREFVKEYDQRIYDFCYYMLQGNFRLDEVVIDIFREFGEYYRRLQSKKSSTWAPHEFRVRLFQLAWEHVRDTLVYLNASLTPGRDVRQMQGMDEDVFRHWQDSGRNVQAIEAMVVERLGRVDPDFRAPVILKDILSFEDEEIVSILGLRWGVYRHRLHRGRLELKDGLKGAR